MPAPLRCPTCSAPIDIPPEHATAARCSYCGAGVLLTERGGHVRAAAAQQHHATAIADVLRSLRAGDKISAIRSYREHFGVGLAEARYAVDRIEAGQAPGTPPARPAGRGGLVMLAGLVGLLTVATPIFFAWRSETHVTVSADDTPVERLAPARGIAGRRGFAEPVLRFGSEGVGAGRFEDARSVAVDGAGRIYVAEYSSGRIQVFDSAGTFLTQWMADPDPLLDLAADRAGTVYVVQSGHIRRYEGATGRVLGEIPRPRIYGYDDVVLALDGSMWAATDYSILHLGADGEVRRTIDLKQAVDERASVKRVAVDANGNLFVLDRWTGHVYHLDPAGKFIDRFEAGSGGPAGHLTMADLAVDGRGRLYVSDMGGGVRVFNASGQLLGTIGGGVVFGITLTDRDELFAAHRNDHQIVKYRLAGKP
jgi:DNA-directed RNA polymerase subunit RPC12/RpoP